MIREFVTEIFWVLIALVAPIALLFLLIWVYGKAIVRTRRKKP